MREQHGLQESMVFVWLVGHLAPWHLPKETIEFFATCKRIMPAARLLLVTQTPKAAELLEGMGLARDDVLIMGAPPEHVPRLVVMGDVGLSMFRAAPFWPMGVKLGEYLASGIAPVVNAGDAEVEGFVRDQRVGALIEGLCPAEYERAAVAVRELMSEGDEVGKRCRRIAEERFSLQSAVDKYQQVYADVLRHGAVGQMCPSGHRD